MQSENERILSIPHTTQCAMKFEYHERGSGNKKSSMSRAMTAYEQQQQQRPFLSSKAQTELFFPHSSLNKFQNSFKRQADIGVNILFFHHDTI